MAEGVAHPYSAFPVAVTRDCARSHQALPESKAQAGNDPNDVLHEDLYEPTVNAVGFFFT